MTDDEIVKYLKVMKRHVEENREGIEKSGQLMFGAGPEAQEMYFKINEYVSNSTNEEREELIAKVEKMERKYKKMERKYKIDKLMK